jgi:hypothetical protein
MKVVRITALVIMPLFVVYTLACLAAPLPAYADEGKVTQRPPETVESQPIEPPKPEQNGISWWWYVLGVGVIAAAAAGGGGGGGGGTPPPTGNNPGGSGSGGTMTVGW